MDLANCTEAELWRHVAGHLERNGIGVTLVGGAVAAIHSRGIYRSGDLDFVADALPGKRLEACMAELGFALRAGHFENPDCPHLIVEFVPPPLGIGADVHIEPQEEVVDGQVLKLLSPTDCVRDRLASAIHFGARECLDQAFLVAQRHEIDWDKVRSWARGEGPDGPPAVERLKRLLHNG